MFKIGNVEVKNRVVLAPLAGYTNSSFRRIAKEFGCGLVYTEMISAKGLIYENDKTWELTKVDPSEHPISLQLFGGEKDVLVKAAKLIEERSNADIIDINMGCPVKKVLKQDAGSELLTDINKIYEIVREITKSVNLAVTAKIRAGYTHDNINCCEVAKALENAGAKAIAIHGRTKSDLYSGKVNLDYIKMVKRSVSIPVIGNGDIKSVIDASRMVEETNVDAVMIGRGALGNPWLIKEVSNFFDNKDDKIFASSKEKIECLIKHTKMMLEIKEAKIALLEMRSMSSFYLKGFKGAKDIKLKILKINDINELLDFFEKLKNEVE